MVVKFKIKRFLPIIVIVFLCSLASVFADSFEVEATPIDNRIDVEEFAYFNITIKNDALEPDEFRITNANFPTWDVRTEPIENPITLELGPNEEGSVEILVDPLKIKEIGTYAVQIHVRSKETDKLKALPLKVIILSTDTLIQGYVPTVLTSVSIPEKIDPREDIPIKITLNNQNVIDYEELRVQLDSNLITETITTPLEPKEEKTIEFKVKLDDFTPPQEDNLIASVFLDDRSIINPQVRQFEITEYSIDKQLSETKGFLSATKKYQITSNNPNYNGEFRVKTDLISSIFSSENPNAELLKENGERYFVWNVQLDGNQTEVSVRKNFLPLFIVIVLLIALFIIYVMLRSPMVVIKETGNVIKKEGGVSEIAVIIHVKNRGAKKLEDIEVTDLIPSLVSVEREVSIGSLQPSKILRHAKKGHTVVKWHIKSLEQGEERVLSYKMKSKLSILGSFNLPAATSVFKQDKKTLTCSSNVLQINE